MALIESVDPRIYFTSPACGGGRRARQRNCAPERGGWGKSILQHTCGGTPTPTLSHTRERERTSVVVADNLKFDHRANSFARAQIVEAAVDVVERDAAGDQFIELEPAVEIGLRQQREIARRPGGAIARSPDSLFAH